jgi:putative endopeptidase
VQGALGEAVGKLYVERHFPPTAKTRMDELVARLLQAYHHSITKLEWMTEATKAEALAKLAAFTPKIGYPEVWKDYSGLVIVPDDLVGNVLRVTEFALTDELSKLGGPIRTAMTPATTAPSVRSSVMRSVTASTTKARPATAKAGCATGGPTRTAPRSPRGRGP